MNQQVTVALLTLAASTGLLLTSLATIADLKFLSARINAGISGLTAGDGPWLLGVMSADLSLAELKEYLELNGPLSPADIVGAERASRGKVVRTLGTIAPSGNGTVAAVTFDNKSLSALRIPEDAAGITPWIYNLGPAMQTGASIRMNIQYFVEWAD